MDGEHAAHKYEKKNNMPKLHLAAISVSEWPQNATCGENKDRRKQKNRPARRASVQTCDNGHVLLACFFDKNVWDFFFAHADTKMLHCSQTMHHSSVKTRYKKKNNPATYLSKTLLCRMKTLQICTRIPSCLRRGGQTD